MQCLSPPGCPSPQVGADLLTPQWPREDLDLLPGVALPGGGVRQRRRPAAGRGSQQAPQVAQGAALPVQVTLIYLLLTLVLILVLVLVLSPS